MRWRRVCVDVDDAGEVLGASVELYDDSTEGANVVCVAAPGEVEGKNPALVFKHVYDRMDWPQMALRFPDPEENWPQFF